MSDRDLEDELMTIEEMLKVCERTIASPYEADLHTFRIVFGSPETVMKLLTAYKCLRDGLSEIKDKPNITERERWQLSFDTLAKADEILKNLYE